MVGSLRVLVHKGFFGEKSHSSVLGGKAMYSYEVGLDAWSSNCSDDGTGRVRGNCCGSVVSSCCTLVNNREHFEPRSHSSHARSSCVYV